MPQRLATIVSDIFCSTSSPASRGTTRRHYPVVSLLHRQPTIFIFRAMYGTLDRSFPPPQRHIFLWLWCQHLRLVNRLCADKKPQPRSVDLPYLAPPVSRYPCVLTDFSQDPNDYVVSQKLLINVVDEHGEANNAATETWEDTDVLNIMVGRMGLRGILND